MATLLPAVTPTPAFNTRTATSSMDTRPQSAQSMDDDVRDMISANLYTRDWTMVGSMDAEGKVTGFLSVAYVESCLSDAPRKRRMRLSLNEHANIETIPFAKAALQDYYDYMVESYEHDPCKAELINLCVPGAKSFCFDILDCYVVVPKSKQLSSEFCSIEVDGMSLVLLMPARAVDSIIDAVTQSGVRILPSEHDSRHVVSSRLRASPKILTSDLMLKEWNRSLLRSEVSGLLPAIAVATATFTVTPVLTKQKSRWAKPLGRYLEFIIHSVK